MSRYIDADALKETIDREIFRHDTIDHVFQIIDDAPTIEPKRGEWIDMGDFEQCSVCKGTHLKEFQSYYGKTTWIKTPYCPYCGAKMADRKTDQTEREGE